MPFWRKPPKVDKLDLILQEMKKMSTSIANVQAAQTAEDQAIAGLVSEVGVAVQALANLATQLQNVNSTDPAIQAIADDMTAKTNSLVAATNSLTTAVAAASAAAPEPAPTGTAQTPSTDASKA